MPTIAVVLIAVCCLALGFGGADVDEVLENTANLIPTGDYIWAAASA